MEFGWILSRRWNRERVATRAVGLISNVQVEEHLEKLWQIEYVPDTNSTAMTEDEQRCEEFFRTAHHRNADGQYVTRSPFKGNDFHLEKSRNVAVATLTQMEKKFRRDPKLKAEYAKCINEYLELGHMKLARVRDEDKVTYQDGERRYLTTR